MPNITIGRYDAPAGWGGWIEGAAADGTSWITFLDTAGRPSVHWPHRSPDGTVAGEPTPLA